jgi:aldose 1-epimerase
MSAKRARQARPTRPSRRQFLQYSGAALAAAGAARRLWAANAGGFKSAPFGKTPDGEAVDVITLANGNGMEVRLMTYGATLLTLKAPDRTGKSDHVNLYFDTLDDYIKRSPLFGAVVGRFANRISNARFTVDGTEYHLTPNMGPHQIHGGNKEAFHRVVWKAPEEPPEGAAAAAAAGGGNLMCFTHTSKDGEAGFPGTLKAYVTYTLTRDNRLILDYTATTDKPTHVNLTNHAYWNLAGAGSGDVRGHVVFIDGDKYLASDRVKIPTGEIVGVEGTPMDFRKPTAVGARIDRIDDKNYDHCYVLNKPAAGERMALAARVQEPKSGRTMEVWTTQPGVQLYTARGLNLRNAGGGATYGPYAGLCLETQHYPDAPNKPAFPTTLLRPGETFHEVTEFRFGAK